MSSTALFRSETQLGRRIERSGPILVDTGLGTVSLHITGDLQSLESLWEELQAAAPCTAVQTYDWARAWARHVLGPTGHEPVIVAGRRADGGLLFLWPFEMGTVGGLRVLKWLGQDHANYCMGLFEPSAPPKLTGEDIARLLGAAAREIGAAAAILKAQPFSWDGVANPFATLPHQPAPSSGYAARLGDFQALYERRFGKRSRSALDRKERKLADAGPLSYGWAETSEARLALLDIFFTQKAGQFAAMGVPDVFDAHARAFYRDVALLAGDNPSRLRIGYVKVGDAVLATFSGTLCHNRLSVSLSSLAEGPLQKLSPGALLLRHQIEEASAAGIAFYDIGVGAARHKDEWCDVVQPLFDSFIAFRPQGLLLTLPLSGIARVKRAIKSDRRLWPLVQHCRRILFGREAGSGH